MSLLRPCVLAPLLFLFSAFVRGEVLTTANAPRTAIQLNDVAPASRMSLLRLADPSRVKVIEIPEYEDPSVEVAERAALPCQNIAYRNLPTSQTSVFLFGGPPGADNAIDDCRLPAGSANRYVCAAQVTTLGFQQGGPATYNLQVQVWSECPGNDGATLLSQGTFMAIPNDRVHRVQTITLDPPHFDNDDTFYILVQSDNPDAGWSIARGTTGPNDVGYTADEFYVSPNTTAECEAFFFGGNPVAGFTCTLLGGGGPLGSCCDLSTGVCTDGVLRNDCNDPLNQAWSEKSCVDAPPCMACSVACGFPGPNPPNREQEADCFTNYLDATNRGCNNLTQGAIGRFWTPLNCTTATSGCGRSGTYTFLNGFIFGGVSQQGIEQRRDDDHYLLELTQDARVTWTVKGRFPSQAIVSFTLRQTNGLSTGVNCPTYLPAEPGDVALSTAASCQESVATACLPGRNTAEGPFRYFLRARPSVTSFGASAVCGLPYEYTLNCEPCDRAPTAAELGACCTTSACIYTSRLACLILTGDDQTYFQGEGSTCPNSACTGAPANDTCPNETVLTCASCVVPYNTSLASSEGQSFGTNGQVYKDVWYRYSVPQPGACANGRVVVSNIGTCFNSKIQMLRVSNCNATATSQCTGLSLTGGISLVPIQLEAGPPILNVGPFVYGRSSQTIVPGSVNGCVKLRVGGLTSSDYGAGTLRVDFVCAATSDSGQTGWDANAGRCCFPDGSCQILPNSGLGSLYTCCGVAGGFIRNRTDFYEGRTPPQTVAAGEVDAVGCAVLPCPAQGEACFNAWNLNALLGGGEGTITRQSTNRIYFKYVVPPSALVDSGLVISTCGSRLDPESAMPTAMDTAFAVYRGQFSSITGECDGSISGGVAPCITAYNNTEIARVEGCGPQDARAWGAKSFASCYEFGESSACLCLKVISSLDTPIAGEVRQGDTIFIGVGAQKSLSNGDSARPFFDPVRTACGGAVEYSLQVQNVAACFLCSLSCPGGASPNPEILPAPPCSGYVDVTNAGCSATSLAEQLFTPIICGQTYCGSSGTYRTNIPCGPVIDCPIGDTCISFVCQGPDDNKQDNDWYRIQITQAGHLTWTVNAAFPTAAQIIHSPTDNCLDRQTIASAYSISGCEPVVVSADVCPGWVYLVAVPTNSFGVPCGSLYYATLSCAPDSVSCCKGDMNNDGAVNGRDIQPWIDQALPVAAGGLPATEADRTFGCFDQLTCRGDVDGDFDVSLADLAGFVTMLLDGEVCNTTECGDPAACHVVSEGDLGVVSDLSTSQFYSGFRCAEDFRVSSGESLTSLCWYGFYFDFTNVRRCGLPAGDSADDFTVTIYSDMAGLPGSVLSGPTSLPSVSKTDTSVDLTYLQYSVRRFKYEATLPSAVAVSPGTCYWIEIVNRTSGACQWLWESSALSGNGVCARKAGSIAGAMNWYSFDLAADDFAFCLPGLRIDSQDCGMPLGRCCVYPMGNGAAVCSMQMQPVCELVMGGVWTPSLTCAVNCPILPENDFCANALLITSGPIYSGSTFFATKDGPAISCEPNCGASCNTANDVWFKWVAQSSISADFTMCDAWVPGAHINGESINSDLFRYDSIIVVYDNCPSAGGVQVLGGCSDDSCNVSGGSTVSRIVLPTVNAGSTYWIRITGWGGNNGQFVLRVNQP